MDRTLAVCSAEGTSSINFGRTGGGLEKLKILILDNDPEFTLWAVDVLSKGQGAEVRTSSSAVDAFQMLRQFPAHIGLVDLGLPQVGGVDFLRWVRDPQQSPNVNLAVVLTAVRADAHMLRQTCEIGINSFMKKPIAEDRFLRRLLVTIANPNWFVIGNDYFGPDRRKEVLPFEGAERRSAKNVQGQATLITPPAAPPPTVTSTLPLALVTKTASPRVRTSVAAPAVAAVRSKAREGKAGDLGETGPAVAESKLSENDIATPVTPAKTDDAWKEALEESAAEEAKQAAKELTIDMAPILAEHQIWLRSGGQDGKRADLRKADLHGANLAGVNLTDADLREAILSNANCRETNFLGADMRYADLSNADASMSNLGVARLRHANMSKTQLNGANLRGSDLAGARLCGAAFDEADLSGCNLLSTDLRQTDITGARGLTQAQVAKARADSSTRLPAGLHLPRAKD